MNRTQVPSRYVLLLHGVKTRGKWQKDVSPLLSAQGFIPIPLDFGYFGALQLMWPPARRKKRRWLLAVYEMECARLRCESPSIVAHSFGCYLVASLLRKYRQVRFDRVIFCGSIVYPTYPWADLVEHGQVNSVLNQYGGADFWAWIVQWTVEDAGPSGYSGFVLPGPSVQQQNHPEFEHSDYFYDLNYSGNWIPFLLGQPVSSVTSGPIPSEPPFNRRFRFVLTLGFLLCLTLMVLAARYYSSSFQGRVHRESRSVGAPAYASQMFGGFVQDDQGDPLPGVRIVAPMLNIPPQTTDANGRFAFYVDLSAGTNFRLIAQKPGFETYTADPRSGDTTFNITLHQVHGGRVR